MDGKWRSSDSDQWTVEEIAALKERNVDRPLLVLNRDAEPHPFTELRMRVNAALSNEKTTVGATIQWDSPMLFAGNQAPDDPPLSIVLADECGRLWKEYHSKMAADEQVHKLVCILDMRVLVTSGSGV